MRTLQRRLRRVEEQFGLSGKSKGLRIVVSSATRNPVPDNDTCVKILGENADIFVTNFDV